MDEWSVLPISTKSVSSIWCVMQFEPSLRPAFVSVQLKNAWGLGPLPNAFPSDPVRIQSLCPCSVLCPLCILQTVHYKRLHQWAPKVNESRIWFEIVTIVPRAHVKLINKDIPAVCEINQVDIYVTAKTKTSTQEKTNGQSAWDAIGDPKKVTHKKGK